MKLIDAPDKIVLPFADAGGKNIIPVPSQIGITPGAASYTDGFPPLTRTEKLAGGLPPDGLDMNGVLFYMSAVDRWANTGASFVYDSTFSTAIGGYPKGAKLLRTDSLGFWLNTVDDNTTDPEAGGAGWVPAFTQGITSVTMTGSNVTLTALESGKPIIVITGLLTGNLSLIFPTLEKQWTVINNTTGSYTITCKTASGTGIQLSSADIIYGNGTNIYSAIPCPKPLLFNRTFNIGTGGDYLTLNAALTDLQKRYFIPFGFPSPRITLNLVAGFVMTEQVFIDGLNFSNYTITGTDASTSITASSLTTGVTLPDGTTYKPAFYIYNGGASPVFDQPFVIDTTTMINAAGLIVLGAGSSAELLSGAGFTRTSGAGFVIACSGAVIVAPSVTIGQISVLDGSKLIAKNINLNAYGGLIVENCSTAYVDGITVASGSSYGIRADNSSKVAAYGATLNGMTTSAIYATNGSEVIANDSTGTGCGGVALYALYSSKISFRNGNVSGATTVGAWAIANSDIDVNGTNCQKGGSPAITDIVIAQGARINAAGSSGGLGKGYPTPAAATANTLYVDGVIYK